MCLICTRVQRETCALGARSWRSGLDRTLTAGRRCREWWCCDGTIPAQGIRSELGPPQQLLTPVCFLLLCRTVSRRESESGDTHDFVSWPWPTVHGSSRKGHRRSTHTQKPKPEILDPGPWTLKSAPPHGDQLGEAAGLEQGGHQHHVGGGIQKVRQRVRVGDQDARLAAVPAGAEGGGGVIPPRSFETSHAENCGGGETSATDFCASVGGCLLLRSCTVVLRQRCATCLGLFGIAFGCSGHVDAAVWTTAAGP